MKIIKYQGKIYKISESTKQNKQLKVELPNGKIIYFGDPTMKEYPGTKRGDNYCARSYGIKGKDDPASANFWSRRYLWNCKNKKSQRHKLFK